MSMDRQTFQKLLAFGVERAVSDIHFEVGYPPHYRLHGELLGAIKVPPLTAQDTEAIARMILEDRNTTVDFTRRFSEIDVSYSLAQRGRFRTSIFRQRGARPRSPRAPAAGSAARATAPGSGSGA